jgi:hypothetical protein
VSGACAGKSFKEVLETEPSYLLYLLERNQERLQRHVEKNNGEILPDFCVPYPYIEEAKSDFLIPAVLNRIEWYESQIKQYKDTLEEWSQ